MTAQPLTDGAVLRGGLWVGAGFLGQQGLALVRTLILARLLTPDDFGLVGVVTLALFAGSMLTELGIESAVIQRQNLPERWLHTAWTLLVLRGGGLTGLQIVLAPAIASVFGRPDAEPLLRVGAFSHALVMLAAVPSALLLRELGFRRRVWLDVTRELAGTAAAVGLALWWGDAWALLAGLLIGQAMTVGQSLWLHAYRPRVVLDREACGFYWDFGRHLYLSGLLGYVVTKGDDITVGRFRGVGELGQYQMAFGIAEMVTRGLGEIVSKAIFPAYTRMAAEGQNLAEGFVRVWGVLLLVLLPIVAVLVMFPSQVLLTILGAQWQPAALPFAVLVVAEALRALAAAAGILILAGGRTAYLSRIKIAEVVCFLLLIVPFTRQWGMIGAATCLVVVYVVSLLGHLYGAQRVVPVLAKVAACSWEPCMVAVSLTVPVWWQWGGMPMFFSALLWIALWGGYVWWRHADLLIMVRRAVRAPS